MNAPVYLSNASAAAAPGVAWLSSVSPYTVYPLPLAPPPVAALLAFVDAHKAAFEVSFMTALYTPFVLLSVSKIAGPQYVQHFGKRHPVLVAHHLVAIVELVRYYSRLAALGHPPAPTLFDTALSVVQIATGFILAAGVAKDLPGVRAAFHMSGVQRLFAVVLAARYGSPSWHRASIKILDSFVWLRYVFPFAGRLAGMPTWRDVYRNGVITAHTMTLWVADYPYGVPTFFLGHLAFLGINASVTAQVKSGKVGIVARILDFLGFGSHPYEKVDTSEKDRKEEAANGAGREGEPENKVHAQ